MTPLMIAIFSKRNHQGVRIGVAASTLLQCARSEDNWSTTTIARFTPSSKYQNFEEGCIPSCLLRLKHRQKEHNFVAGCVL